MWCQKVPRGLYFYLNKKSDAWLIIIIIGKIGVLKLAQIDQTSLAGPRENILAQTAPLLFVSRRKTCAKVYFCDRCDVVNYTVLLHFSNTFGFVGSQLLVRFGGYPLILRQDV